MQNEITDKSEQVRSAIEQVVGAFCREPGKLKADVLDGDRKLAVVLTVDPVYWQTMMFAAMAWLPLLLLHTTVQTVMELRQRCDPATQPIPIQPLSRYALPVILYDEQGNPLNGDDSMKMN